MSETDEPEIRKKEKVPFHIWLICSIGILGMIAVIAGSITKYHPLMIPAGWGCFVGANLLLVLNAIFRKKRSDIMGEFHAYNLVSWMVSGMLTVALGGLFILIAFASTFLFETQKWTISGPAKIGAIAFSSLIAYGWIRWFITQRKRPKS
jgi:drug/metabolite transporter (DMT)-like permease